MSPLVQKVGQGLVLVEALLACKLHKSDHSPKSTPGLICVNAHSGGIWPCPCDSITSCFDIWSLISSNLRSLSNMLRLLNYTKSALSETWTDVLEQQKRRGGLVAFRTVCGIIKIWLQLPKMAALILEGNCKKK